MERIAIASWATSPASVTPANVGEGGSARFLIDQVLKFAIDLKRLFPTSEVFVIGTHKVYSATYPVVCVDIPELCLKIYGSCNRFAWSLTVESEMPIEGFEAIANRDGPPFYGCFNGFGAANAPFYEAGYDADHRRFSFFAPPLPKDTLRDITTELIKARRV